MTRSRRDVLRYGSILAGLTATEMLAWAMGHSAGTAEDVDPFSTAPTAIDDDPTTTRTEYDYVVIGSGAGGAPVAANLAAAGFSVCVLEAGPFDIDRVSTTVPAFHLFASSHPSLSWDFYVRHYTEAARHSAYTWVGDRGGVLYPRAATLGGCTAHHAMLTLRPENADWDDIAALTGDPSWNSFAMNRYFDRVRRWLPIEQASPAILLRDRMVARLVAAGALTNNPVGRNLGRPVVDLNRADFSGLYPDPNTQTSVDNHTEGMFLIPQCTAQGRRRGTADLLISTQRAHRDRLFLQSNALVERILFTSAPSGRLVATEVEFLHGRYLYRASPLAKGAGAQARARIRRRIRARREVILCGGAFNSPQVLMLSGIGPDAHLRQHGIEPILNLPGVGGNLQDRYEMTVVTRFDRPFAIAEGATFGAPGDPYLADYRRGNMLSPYRTNGIVAGVKKRFSQGSDHPELFVFGAPSRFEGYAPGFAKRGVADRNNFTWAVLRGYAKNDIGTVRLRSSDPTQTPDINFRYFGDGEAGELDLAAMREGLALARRMNSNAAQFGLLEHARSSEMFPGPGVSTPEQINDFVKAGAWGHHATCSNPIGPADDPRSVVDSRFLVHGTANLRIVDASVFPKIPGLFPVLAIHMIGEKASDDILAAVRGTR